MKVCVDAVKCDTSGECVKICPEIFRFAPGSNKAEVMISTVPVMLQTQCRAAAAKCPRCAILIEE